MHSDFEAQWVDIQFLDFESLFSISFTFYNHYLLCIRCVWQYLVNLVKMHEMKDATSGTISPLCVKLRRKWLLLTKGFVIIVLKWCVIIRAGLSIHYSMRLKRFINSCLHIMQLSMYILTCLQSYEWYFFNN